jgi:cytidylate kinase
MVINMNTATLSAPVIAIDGPSGSGKGTLCSLLARELNWALLDSGAIYRIVALAALAADTDLSSPPALTDLVAGLNISFEAAQPGKTTRIFLGGDEVTDDIRTETVGEAASKVAAIPEVRAALLALQQGFCQLPGLVADGRDMGTVVFPNAPIKIFLTASAEARAERRYKQLQLKGETGSLAALLEEIQARDDRDMNRSAAPLKPASDAIELDSTQMSIEEVYQTVMQLVKERI